MCRQGEGEHARWRAVLLAPAACDLATWSTAIRSASSVCQECTTTHSPQGCEKGFPLVGAGGLAAAVRVCSRTSGFREGRSAERAMIVKVAWAKVSDGTSLTILSSAKRDARAIANQEASRATMSISRASQGLVRAARRARRGRRQGKRGERLHTSLEERDGKVLPPRAERRVEDEVDGALRDLRHLQRWAGRDGEAAGWRGGWC